MFGIQMAIALYKITCTITILRTVFQEKNKWVDKSYLSL